MAMISSFGRNPSKAQLETFRTSPHFKEGEFQNMSPTEIMQNKEPLVKSVWKFLRKPANATPSRPLPSIKTDLRHLGSEKPVIVWFGHSSYFIRIGGKNILVDPVFGGHASPFRMGVSSFAGTEIYSAIDFPDIDILIITHDHYDHLDHGFLLQMKKKIRSVVTPLGVSAHLVYWGFDRQIITELDWWQQTAIAKDIMLTATPARHFSGRTLTRNKTLWCSYVLECQQVKIYIGSDSGYDTHFKSIGEKFGPFDIALLETGQYNDMWPLIHMTPEDAVKAAIDLNARRMLPVHWGKFSLAFHPWYEPIERVVLEATKKHVQITTPQIGEPVFIGGTYPQKKWWESLATLDK
jgi:L-ascorbate metabolism protein UlaG (beta-lactamase superfamily)